MTAEILNRFYGPKAVLTGKSHNYTWTEAARKAGRRVPVTSEIKLWKASKGDWEHLKIHAKCGNVTMGMEKFIMGLQSHLSPSLKFKTTLAYIVHLFQCTKRYILKWWLQDCFFYCFPKVEDLRSKDKSLQLHKQNPVLIWKGKMVIRGTCKGLQWATDLVFKL